MLIRLSRQYGNYWVTSKIYNVDNLFNKIISAPDALSKFRNSAGQMSACIYPTPFEGKAEVVRWFYSRNNACQIFYACSQIVSDKIESDNWGDVSHDFTLFVEHELMPHCVDNTDWDRCSKYGYEYNEKIPKSKRQIGEEHFEFGCMGSNCHCEPFGGGDFTNGIASVNEFILM